MDATARAITGRGPVSAATARGLAYLKTNPAAVFGVVHASAALGDLNTMFALLEGYYFGVGAWSKLAPGTGDRGRATEALFQPPMQPAGNDARFAQLLQRIGLEDYWRQSGTLPDFRHR